MRTLNSFLKNIGDRGINVQKKRSNKLTGFFLCLIIIIGVLVSGFFWVRETPRYSLYKFKRAILNHDADAALKYLAIDSIIENGLKQMPDSHAGGSKKNISKDIIVQNLPAIKQQLHEQLRSAIMSYNDQATLEKLRKASVLGVRIRQKGDTAIVNVIGKDQTAFTMAKSKEGYWKITSLNIEELL